MLKSFGLLVATVAAPLVLSAPAASAASVGEHGSCPSTTDEHGNSGQLNTCNVFGQHDGEGNTFNGMPIGDSPLS